MSQAPPAETVVSSGGDAAVVKDKKAEEWKPRISVFNLPPGVTSRDELRELCKPFGSITEVEFVPAKGNRSAFGFVTFKTKGDAEYAIYRLNEDKFGGKVPVRAKWPPEKTAAPKEDGGSSEKRPIKQKPKKALQPLSLLTPKNVASNAPQQTGAQSQQFQQKKGWDIPAAPVQNQQQGGQQGQGQKKQNFQQDPNRPQNPNPRKKRGNPNAQNQGQQGQQQNPQNSHPVANHQKPGNQQGNNGQHQNQQKPVHPNQGQNKGQQQKKAQNQQQNEQNQQNTQQQAPANPQQGPGRKQKQQGGQQQPAAPQQNVQQQHQQVEQHAAPQQNNAQHTQPQNNQQQGQQQPRPPRKNNKKKPFVVTVSDGKTGLPLHVIHLSKPQFDQYLGPLVVKPNPQ